MLQRMRTPVPAYTLRHTGRRRSLALVVLPDGSLEVRAPKWVKRPMIEQFVRERTPWIEKKRAERDTLPRVEPRRWQTGDIFYFYGQSHTLEVIAGSRVSVRLAGGKIILTQQDPQNTTRVRHNLMNWFKEEAYQHFLPVLYKHADRMGEKPPKLLISIAKQRWGSCLASRREIRLSIRLLMAPQDVQEYVMIHELAHLKHMNHGNRFWARVAAYSPNWEEHEKALRDHNSAWVFD